VWFTSFDPASGAWDEPVLISRSGPLPAYEPAVLLSGSRIDVVWAKDLDGDRQTREAVWHSFSGNGGRTWSRPRQLAAGRHLWRPALVPLGSGRLGVLYLESASYGSPGKLRLAVHDGRRWRRAGRIPIQEVSDFGVLTTESGGVDVALVSFSDAPGAYRIPGVS
jgi:hypothetical protein